MACFPPLSISWLARCHRQLCWLQIQCLSAFRVLAIGSPSDTIYCLARTHCPELNFTDSSKQRAINLTWGGLETCLEANLMEVEMMKNINKDEILQCRNKHHDAAMRGFLYRNQFINLFHFPPLCPHTVCLQMFPQTSCLRGWKATLVAFQAISKTKSNN